MQAIYNLLYEPPIPLKWMGLLIGLWLVGSHIFALAKPGLVKPWLRAFPRNEKLGTVLVVIAFAWTFVIWSCMDLGEFFKIEKHVQIVLVAGCIGVIVHVKEFLAVRSLGFLMILAAAPILDSAFLQEPQTRLLLVAFAYALALKGMFWVGMPYLLRDQIHWILAKENRYRTGAVAGAVYGLVVLGCAMLWW
ncbi:MAG: hypothetical protein GXX91_14215 [Verrucomicrobiaceae bacterium]|nr:hypothetical protein [Verrucomicrobiaceae bacterium]